MPLRRSPSRARSFAHPLAPRLLAVLVLAFLGHIMDARKDGHLELLGELAESQRVAVPGQGRRKKEAGVRVGSDEIGGFREEDDLR